MDSMQWACTDFEIMTHTYEWKLKNFSLHSTATGEPLRSPKFSSGKNEEEQWQIDLYLDGVSADKKDYIAIYLKRVTEKTDIPLTVDCEFSIINPKTGGKMWPFILSRKFKDKVWGNDMFVFKRIMTQNKDDYFLDDTLTIQCELKIYEKVEHVSKPKAILAEAQAAAKQQNLGTHLKQFFNVNSLSDVTVIARDKQFPAHKVILSAQSRVFSSMFANEMTSEDKKSEIHIKQLTPEITEEMLYYIYTNEIRNESLVYDLLHASEKYELAGLKALCEVVLLRELKVENAAEILNYADLYCCQTVEKYVIDYIVAHETEVVKTNGFKNLVDEDPVLVARLYQARLKKFNYNDNGSQQN